jgi:predicted GIY-YIG superfamily endonuclease
MKNKNWWLYVLELEGGKYYVGITSQTPEIRMQEHIHHVRSAYWTMKYKPLQIIYRQDLGQISKEEAEKIESLKTQDLMNELGINNVRGGHLRNADDEYILFLNRYFLKEDWQIMLFVIFQAVVILILLTILQRNGIELRL